MPDVELWKYYNTNHMNMPFQRNRLFKKSGVNVIGNKNLIASIFCLPIGMNGIGGHNHYDVGSFTISHLGIPIIVDPGTFTYTSDFRQRNRFRSYNYHNTVIPEAINDTSFNLEGIFRLTDYYTLLNSSLKD